MAPDEEPWWFYRARPDPTSDHEHGVVDGDTVDLLVDKGFSDYSSKRLRLDGVDAAEIYGVFSESEEAQAGEDHTTFVRGWIAHGVEEWDEDRWPFTVRTEKDETGKYGRLVATVTRRCDGEVLSSGLIEAYPSTEDAEE